QARRAAGRSALRGGVAHRRLKDLDPQVLTIAPLMTLGDVNKDGNTDIASVREGTGTLYLWNGKGSNNFSSAIEMGPGWTPYF
ncbi:VCBS repeat-containing protein, partial [Nonomuraea sp. NPDC049750]|uniref:FG-GAP repeat domain-containing protein n=1 Tax=Nonomuraea sp. NPDC049750 TaxID=3154738 RepID=UPI00340926DD